MATLPLLSFAEVEDVYRVGAYEMDVNFCAQVALEAGNEMANKLEQVQLPTKVKLDVGGQTFATSIAVLTKLPDSFFGITFSGRWQHKLDESGCLFIDRDPSVFGQLLQFLREWPYNKLDISLLSPTQLAQLTADAKHYRLPELLDYLHPYVVPLHAHLQCTHFSNFGVLTCPSAIVAFASSPSSV